MYLEIMEEQIVRDMEDPWRVDRIEQGSNFSTHIFNESDDGGRPQYPSQP
jgi:hypothetical protein